MSKPENIYLYSNEGIFLLSSDSILFKNAFICFSY